MLALIYRQSWQGVADLQLGRNIVCKPFNVVQARTSKGEMGRVARQHQSRTITRKGGTREVYRCACKAIVRAEPVMDSASIGNLLPGDIIEELYEIDADGTRRLNFETVWSTRGPDLGLSGWISAVSSTGETILEALSPDGADQWRLGAKPTLLRRSIAMFGKLAEQSLVYKADSGGGVYTCVKPGVIRASKDRFVCQNRSLLRGITRQSRTCKHDSILIRNRESEKVGQLTPDSIVPVSAAETLPSGVERVRFDSKLPSLEPVGAAFAQV